jgi:hypothetical protein
LVRPSESAADFRRCEAEQGVTGSSEKTLHDSASHLSERPEQEVRRFGRHESQKIQFIRPIWQIQRLQHRLLKSYKEPSHPCRYQKPKP